MQTLQVRIRLLSRNAPDRDIDATSKVMSEAFYNEISTRVFLGGHLELTSDFVSAIVKAGIVGGEVYVAEDNFGKIIGASVWFPPGHEFLDSEEQAKAGYNQFMEKLNNAHRDMLRWWTKYFGPLADEFVKKTFGDPHYGSKCWYLYLIGVQPVCQRRGVGTALVNDCEARIRARSTSDKLSSTIALGATTQRTFDFYQKRHFVEKGRFDVESVEELKETMTMRFYTKLVH
ncbi:hypothetical protein SCHPADRAFT_488459 [Schizopora paradoxa]|uniref:N-acetyltransferase domain-containing protein n=1 Tax=Schizopora paradoxa TaxID=27342 RepID=A0A0H2S266_9AGAM|nr:hypothetical protein SCHPADRAFT_488459 [Schizopora paradoxa]